MSKQPDYSFMKTGFNNVISNKPDQPDVENLEVMLALFISNATTNGAKYYELASRNGLTKEDIIYGLRYEVFEFLNRDNIMEELNNIKDEMKEEESDYGIGWTLGWEWYELLDGVEKTGWHWEGDGPEPTNKPTGSPPLDFFEDYEDLIEDEEIDNFTRVSELNVSDENKVFVKKMNDYYDTWDSWIPQNNLEEILKVGIDKAYDVDITSLTQ